MSLEVSIGLLWDEAQIRGELVGDFLVRCRVDCCRFLALEKTSGRFEAIAKPGRRQGEFGIRMAESFSPEHADKILSTAVPLAGELDLDIIEAGRTWQSGDNEFDNRVWWPVVKLPSRDDAEIVLEKLRGLPEVEPLGLSLVRLDTSVPDLPFEFSIGDFSTKALEVWATPLAESSQFALDAVPIGRGFHWERKERLAYRGRLRLLHPGGAGLTASNALPLESYLESAVGSEMRSDLPPAFSQAQAIAARSTVLATANRHHHADGFDLCNDDHCQCYQGLAREVNAVIAPIRESSGKVLISSFIPHPSALPRVADARYAKSCGGVSERYEAAWGGEGPDYFAIRACGEFAVPDLSDENNARAFLRDAPAAWCNPAAHPYPEPWDADPLYRWEFTRTRAEWGKLFAEKTGADVGAIQSLAAVRRGKSGRILILDVIGAAGIKRIYGELTIRRALSPSHLPASYFVCEEHGDAITLSGGGWGHGVGLCQLGAAAMAKNGIPLERILAHYYPNSELMNL